MGQGNTTFACVNNVAELANKLPRSRKDAGITTVTSHTGNVPVDYKFDQALFFEALKAIIQNNPAYSFGRRN